MLNLVQFVQWICLVVVTFYEENIMGLLFPHPSLPHFNKPEVNLPEVPKIDDIETEENIEAMEMGKIAAGMTGHESTEEILTIALAYTREHDNMEAATSLIEGLLADGLTEEQRVELEKWDKKIDAAIKLGKFAPKAKEQMNDQVKSFTGGNLDIDQLDMLIHVVLGKNQQ